MPNNVQNNINYADIFMKMLDAMIVQESRTGWMDANAGQVIYNGGRTIKVPKMGLTGLGNYSRSNGFKRGKVSLEYEEFTMTQDRGTQFLLDSQDVDESNFVANASAVMAEFQRTYVVPEVDAYRISKIATTAISKDGEVEYGYTPAEATILGKLKDGIDHAGDNCVIMATPAVVKALEVKIGTNNIQSQTFSHGGIDTRVPSLDGVPIIKVDKTRMITALTISDINESGTGGGWAKGSTALDINFMVMPRIAPIGVNKLDKPRVFTPDQVEDYDAWKINYRRYHDLWVMDNKAKKLFVNIKDAKPSGGSE